jgi:sugar lactone lactonase YvrE
MVTTAFVVQLVCALYALIPKALAFEPYRYLIISAPRLSKVVYMKVGDKGQTRPLVDSGLKSPQGLAIDQKRQKLYVTDPDSRKIFSYSLVFNNGVLLTDGKQTVAAQNVEARWVAVDGVGSIFFTDERDNLIQKVSAEKILRGDPTPTVLYSGISVHR